MEEDDERFASRKRRRIEIEDDEIEEPASSFQSFNEDGTEETHVRAPIPDRRGEMMLEGDFFQERFNSKTMIVTPFNIVENLRGNGLVVFFSSFLHVKDRWADGEVIRCSQTKPKSQVAEGFTLSDLLSSDRHPS